MAGMIINLYRNYTESDTVYSNRYSDGQAIPSVETIGWDSPSGKVFKEWNSSRDGSGDSYQPGEYQYAHNMLYVIWEEESQIDYLTTNTELTSIANAIRTKGGTSASLVYPAGFVTAIGNIQSAYPSADGEMFGTVPSIISFSIKGTSYTADSGMTWAEWVASEYNPTYEDPFGTYPLYGIDGNNIKNMQMAMYIYVNSSTRVLKTDTIIENTDYPWGY